MTNNSLTFYMIQNSEGKFSCGGEKGKFSSNGKVWYKWSHVINHLYGYMKGKEINHKYFYINEIPMDWKIIEYSLRFSDGKNYGICERDCTIAKDLFLASSKKSTDMYKYNKKSIRRSLKNEK